MSPEEPAAAMPISPQVSQAWSARASEWTRIFAAYFTTQTLTQLAGIAAGLLLINFMEVREFALYTLALSVVTFFSFATDLGSGASLLHFYRRAQAPGALAFASYWEAAAALRRWAFTLGAAVVVTAFPLAAQRRGFAPGESAAVTAGVLACVFFQIGASLSLLVLRLHDRYGQSYRAELAGAGVRLALALLLVATGWLRAGAALAAAVAATAVTAVLARPAWVARASADVAAGRRQILRYLLPTLPGAAYFALQGPLVVWLAASFGEARNVAEVGALGRLGLVVGLFSGLTGTVFLPRLARTSDEAAYRFRYLAYGASLAVVAAALLGMAALAPGLFLLLLGPQYAGLHRELLLVVAGAGLSLVDGYAVSVNAARSWTRWQPLAVFVLLAAQVAFALSLPLGTTAGVLIFNLLSAAVAGATQLAITLVGFSRPRWVEWS